MKQRHKAEIWGIYVVPAQRRGGLARQLTEALLARAARMTGVRHVLLSVGADNGAAHSAVRQPGLRRVWPRARRDAGGRAACWPIFS
ncbi:GNAT family N-acetyltransferase [Bordetella pertussis]|uniref:GNAT family N-acetyltransferase n=1 Tax=Bordetella pertussis TaxID=520 RepID=UPI0028EEA086|nr:GNAT family N-acetyltransferase [Bordetella pertussis]WNQ45558.1 GNAT family N-acetyltransferase [Bordetella pertussis]